MRAFALFSVLLLCAGWATGSEIRVWGPATTCPEVLTVPEGLNDAVQIEAGTRHVLALKADGTVVAWGKNDVGQLNVPAGLVNVVKISTISFTNLAIRSDGTFVMWGNNLNHQMNIPAGVTNIVSGAPSFYDTVVILPDGSLRQWGDFATGTLPTVTTAQEAGLEAGLGLVRLANQTVAMWYDPGEDPSRITAFTPPSSLLVTRLVGPRNQCAALISTTGALTVLTMSTGIQAQTPTGLISSNVADVAIGSNHILALKNDGTLMAWSTDVAETAALATPIGWSHPIHISGGNQFNVGLWSAGAPNGSSPSDITITPAMAAVGTTAGVDVGTLKAVDGDPGDRHLYFLVGGSGDNDNAQFSIIANRLVTQVMIPLSKSAISIRVRAVDSGGLAFEKELHIATTGASSEGNPSSENENGGIGGCGLGGASLLIAALLFVMRWKVA